MSAGSTGRPSRPRASEDSIAAAAVGFSSSVRVIAPRIRRVGAPFRPAVEVGWRLAREAWGFGYATEAGRAAMRYGFEAVGLDEIVSFTAVGNARSRRVMERLGMTRDPADDFDHPRIEPGR